MSTPPCRKPLLTLLQHHSVPPPLHVCQCAPPLPVLKTWCLPSSPLPHAHPQSCSVNHPPHLPPPHPPTCIHCLPPPPAPPLTYTRKACRCLPSCAGHVSHQLLQGLPLSHAVYGGQVAALGHTQALHRRRQGGEGRGGQGGRGRGRATSFEAAWGGRREECYGLWFMVLISLF